MVQRKSKEAMGHASVLVYDNHTLAVKYVKEELKKGQPLSIMQ